MSVPQTTVETHRRLPVQPQVSLRQLWYFIAPAETGSLAAAGERLDVSASGAGTLSLGCCPSLATSVLPAVLAAFVEKHWDVHVSSFEDTPPALHRTGTGGAACQPSADGYPFGRR